MDTQKTHDGFAKAANPYVQAGKDFVGNVLGVGKQELPAPGAADRLRRYAYFMTENQKDAGDAMLVMDLWDAVKALERQS